jgi:hypothetical protein
MTMRKRTCISLLLAVAICISGGCKRNVSGEPMLVRIAVDPNTQVAPWLFSEVVRFNALSPKSNTGKRVQATTVLKTDYVDLLGTLSSTRRVDLVVLGFDSERDYLKALPLDPGSGIPLARVAMVAARIPGNAAPPSSMVRLLRLAQNGKIQLWQGDAKQHSAGLGALVLEAYGAGAVTAAGGLDADELRRMLSWLPARIKSFDLEGANRLGKNDVVIISEDQCAALREKITVEAFYPTDGTIEIDYRAYVSHGASAEERDAVQQFLSFLRSGNEGEASTRRGISQSCTGSPLPRVLPMPSIATLHTLLDSWSPAAQ